MKVLLTSLVVAFLATGTAFAQESSTPQEKSSPTATTENAVNAITGKDKKARKKKAAMCNECGKPEAECECKGHKEGEKK